MGSGMPSSSRSMDRMSVSKGQWMKLGLAGQVLLANASSAAPACNRSYRSRWRPPNVALRLAKNAPPSRAMNSHSEA